MGNYKKQILFDLKIMNTRCIFIGGKQLGVNCLKVLLKNDIRPEIVIGNPDDNLEDNTLHDSLLKYADLENLEIVRDKNLSDPQIIYSFNKIGKFAVIYKLHVAIQMSRMNILMPLAEKHVTPLIG